MRIISSKFQKKKTSLWVLNLIQKIKKKKIESCSILGRIRIRIQNRTRIRIRIKMKWIRNTGWNIRHVMVIRRAYVCISAEQLSYLHVFLKSVTYFVFCCCGRKFQSTIQCYVKSSSLVFLLGSYKIIISIIVLKVWSELCSKLKRVEIDAIKEALDAFKICTTVWCHTSHKDWDIDWLIV